MGPHAKQSEAEIFTAKAHQVGMYGRCFWLYHSMMARPDQVQELCGRSQPSYCIFVKGRPQPTKLADVATEFATSRDGPWASITPAEIRPTGKLGGAPCAMIFDALELPDQPTDVFDALTLNLLNYSPFGLPSQAIDTQMPHSTVCCERTPSRNDKDQMQDVIRHVVAVARLQRPFGVWVRKA